MILGLASWFTVGIALAPPPQNPSLFLDRCFSSVVKLIPRKEFNAADVLKAAMKIKKLPGHDDDGFEKVYKAGLTNRLSKIAERDLKDLRMLGEEAEAAIKNKTDKKHIVDSVQKVFELFPEFVVRFESGGVSPIWILETKQALDLVLSRLELILNKHKLKSLNQRLKKIRQKVALQMTALDLELAAQRLGYTYAGKPLFLYTSIANRHFPRSLYFAISDGKKPVQPSRIPQDNYLNHIGQYIDRTTREFDEVFADLPLEFVEFKSKWKRLHSLGRLFYGKNLEGDELQALVSEFADKLLNTAAYQKALKTLLTDNRISTPPIFDMDIDNIKALLSEPKIHKYVEEKLGFVLKANLDQDLIERFIQTRTLSDPKNYLPRFATDEATEKIFAVFSQREQPTIFDKSRGFVEAVRAWSNLEGYHEYHEQFILQLKKPLYEVIEDQVIDIYSDDVEVNEPLLFEIATQDTELFEKCLKKMGLYEAMKNTQVIDRETSIEKVKSSSLLRIFTDLEAAARTKD